MACIFGLTSLLGCKKQQEEHSSAKVGFTQHIKPIIDVKCARCHTEGGQGPFSLDSFEQLQKHAQASLTSIKERRMPPWPADRECREYLGDYSLTKDEIKLFEEWVAAGAPEEAEAEVQPPPHFETTALTRVDLEIKNSEPYVPSPFPEDTRCFVIDWPHDQVKYITGMDVIPEARQLVHHSSVFLTKPENREFYRELDRKDGSPTDGYPCSATMGVGKSSALWIGGWLPGLDGFDFAFGAGIEVQPGASVILQVHYHLDEEPEDLHLHGQTIEPDQTAIRFKLEDQVDRLGTLVTMVNPDWMVEEEMDIPAGEPNVVHDFEGEIDVIPSLIGQDFKLEGDRFEILSLNMHGHSLMTGARMKVKRANGEEECLVDIPKFQFDYQLNYIFKEAASINRGDKIFMECRWDNSPANQPVVNGSQIEPMDVNWGDGARQEMCIGLLFVSESQEEGQQ